MWSDDGCLAVALRCSKHASRSRDAMGVALRHGRLVRIVCLVTGHVRAKAGQRGVRRYVVDEWRDEAMPVNAFLIEFTDGSRCLFDTGQTARAAAPRWFPFWHPFFRLSRFELTPADEIAPQLRSIGVEPGSSRHRRALPPPHGSRRRHRRLSARSGDRAPVGVGAGDGCRGPRARLPAPAMARPARADARGLRRRGRGTVSVVL